MTDNKTKKKPVRREDLFPPICLEEETLAKSKCEPEGGRAAFLISEGALNRLLKLDGDDKSSGSKTSKLIENQEQEWRNKELCIDRLHAEKVGIDDKSILSLEKAMDQLKEICGGEFDVENKPLLECYQANMISPLKCRGLVLQYMQTVAKYRQQRFGIR